MPAAVTSRAWDAATEYAQKFDQVEVDEGEGDDEGAGGASGDPQD